MVIDFFTGRTLNQPEAVVSILGFDDPDIRFDIIKHGRCMVEGLVVPDLAVQMQTLVAASGKKLEIFDWADPYLIDTPRDECRVVIEGVMSLEMALQLRALCKEYNAKLTRH